MCRPTTLGGAAKAVDLEPEDSDVAAGIVIPVLNEARSLRPLIQRLRAIKELQWILFVDDDSEDGTSEALIELCKQVPNLDRLHRKGRRGLGTALQEAMRHAISTYDFDRLVVMDGDLSHDPDMIPHMLRVRADLVLGSRYAPGGRIENWPLPRRLISWAACSVARSALGLPVSDVTTGFRVYSRRLASLIASSAHSGGYEFQVEAVDMAHRNGFVIREIPIVFRDRADGRSKLSTPFESYRFFRFVLLGGLGRAWSRG